MVVVKRTAERGRVETRLYRAVDTARGDVAVPVSTGLYTDNDQAERGLTTGFLTPPITQNRPPPRNVPWERPYTTQKVGLFPFRTSSFCCRHALIHQISFRVTFLWRWCWWWWWWGGGGGVGAEWGRGGGAACIHLTRCVFFLSPDNLHR